MIADDLIFDVGLHRGEDSRTYLAQGYRIIAFEADPALVAAAELRFAAEIAAGRLTIVSGAIGPEGAPTLKFYRNPADTQWSTIDPAWVERNAGLGSAAIETVEVPRVDMAAQIRQHGVPIYMKIDIEGADMVALAALKAAPARPRFVSIESNKTSFAALRAEFRLLQDLGYRSFKLSQQYRPGAPPQRLTRHDGTRFELDLETGSSGEWGHDLPGAWLSARQAIAAYIPVFLRYRTFGDNTPIQRLLGPRGLSYLGWRTGWNLNGWYDTHARLGD